MASKRSSSSCSSSSSSSSKKKKTEADEATASIDPLMAPTIDQAPLLAASKEKQQQHDEEEVDIPVCDVSKCMALAGLEEAQLADNLTVYRCGKHRFEPPPVQLDPVDLALWLDWATRMFEPYHDHGMGPATAVQLGLRYIARGPLASICQFCRAPTKLIDEGEDIHFCQGCFAIKQNAAMTKKKQDGSWLVGFKVWHGSFLPFSDDKVAFFADSCLQYARATNVSESGKYVCDRRYTVVMRRCNLTKEAIGLLQTLDQPTARWDIVLPLLASQNAPTVLRPYLFQPKHPYADLPHDYQSFYINQDAKIIVMTIVGL